MQYLTRIHTGVVRPEAHSKISSILFSPVLALGVAISLNLFGNGIPEKGIFTSCGHSKHVSVSVSAQYLGPLGNSVSHDLGPLALGNFQQQARLYAPHSSTLRCASQTGPS